MTALAPQPTKRPPHVRAGRVFLAGAFGQGNPGDEALLAAFTRALHDHHPLAASTDPAATAAAHGIAAVDRDDLPRVAREIARAEAVVIAGGTVFKALHPACGRARLSLLRRTAALAGVSKALRKPLALVGVGAAPLHGPAARALARVIVRAADLLVLRDEESAIHLAELGVPTPFRVGADSAWTLVPDPPAATREGPVVVALSHLAGGRELADRLAGGLEPVLDAGIPLRLDPWQPDGDAALAAAVVSRLGDRVQLAPPPADLLAARSGMLRSRLVLAQRFHAVVAAASAGVPVLAVAHEPKLAGLARRLDQPAVAADAPPATLSSAVLSALDCAPPSPASILRERAAAEEGFRLLRVLLARGRSEEAVDVDGLALRPEEWLG
jgi:polysaccharide pyruvyl transferase WcaK-like protein